MKKGQRVSKNFRIVGKVTPYRLLKLASDNKSVYCEHWGSLKAARFIINMSFNLVMYKILVEDIYEVEKINE